MSRINEILKQAAKEQDRDALWDAIIFGLGGNIRTPLFIRATTTEPGLLKERISHPRWHQLLKLPTGAITLEDAIIGYLILATNEGRFIKLHNEPDPIRFVVQGMKWYLLDLWEIAKTETNKLKSTAGNLYSGHGEQEELTGNLPEEDINEDASLLDQPKRDKEAAFYDSLWGNKLFMDRASSLLKEDSKLCTFLVLHEKGEQLQAIAEEMQISIDTLGNWRKKWGLDKSKKIDYMDTTIGVILKDTLPDFDYDSTHMFLAILGVFYGLALSIHSSSQNGGQSHD